VIQVNDLFFEKINKDYIDASNEIFTLLNIIKEFLRLTMYQNEHEIKYWCFANGIEYKKIKNSKFLFDKLSKQINNTNISVNEDNIIK
jgi:hypothetical protein